ncbi:hypothetical protein RS130_01260 [Paraglaciecola aquimarina]|uniref:Uncharacterized protein n=1 Tax=Paraglaciecola aquimarina TaxID=1235557 RepID=A0ABU3SRT4_9ALTE|nr:hypothetical protein [Paraglaciecola aquimarina]MDU0352726.1 hypothetical protein [Paraglaciecola aquimarina]
MKMFYFFTVLALLPITNYSWANHSDFKIFRALDSETPPANIAVSKNGRVFMSTHQAYGSPHKMIELLADGSFTPYPEKAFFPPLNGVLGAIVDEKDILWFLDTIWGEDALGRVIGWDTKNEKLYKIFYITRPIVNQVVYFE